MKLMNLFRMAATSDYEVEVQAVKPSALIEVYALKQETHRVEIWGELLDGTPEVGMQYLLIQVDPDELTLLEQMVDDIRGGR